MSHAAERISRFSLLASLAIHFSLLLFVGYLLGQGRPIDGDMSAASSGETPAVVDIDVRPAHDLSVSAGKTAIAAGEAVKPDRMQDETSPTAGSTANVAGRAEPVVPSLPDAGSETDEARPPANDAKSATADVAQIAASISSTPLLPEPSVAAPPVPPAVVSPVATNAPPVAGADQPPPSAAAEAAAATEPTTAVLYARLRRRQMPVRSKSSPVEPPHAAVEAPAATAYILRKRLIRHPRVENRAADERNSLPPVASPATTAALAAATGRTTAGAAKAAAVSTGASETSSRRRAASQAQAKAYGAQLRRYISQRRPLGNGTEGTAVVGFALSPSGSLQQARLRVSSGDGELDQMALDAVRGAEPFPPPPAGMTPSQLRFSIPFRFR